MRRITPACLALGLAAVRRFASAPALIVDVRGNSAGTTPMALMGALMNQPWRWFAEATAAEPGLDRNRRPRSMLRWAPLEMAAGDSAQAGRLVALADVGCWSACEGFLVPFRDSGRGIIIGAATGGRSGQPEFFDLGRGYQFQVSTKREYLPDRGRVRGGGHPAPRDRRAHGRGHPPRTRPGARTGTGPARRRLTIHRQPGFARCDAQPSS